MKKTVLILFLILGMNFTALGQLFTFGVQVGPNYSNYLLIEDNGTINVVKGSVGFHSGFFCRYDFENFFVGADINYSSILGGTIDDGTSRFIVRTGSVNIPLMTGKKFYPGIRLYAGGMPTVYIKTNDNELKSYLESSPATISAGTSSLYRNDFIFFIMAGFEVDVAKFTIGARYEHPLDYFVREDYSTGGTISNINNYHFLAQITLTVGYIFN